MTEIKSSLHNHTTLCDGRATPDELISAAISEGLSDIGISGHSRTPFDIDYCVKDTESYINAIASCKVKFKDSIRVWCGIEQDFFSPRDCISRFDYIIGSVHYIYSSENGRHYPIDASLEQLLNLRDELFGGDVYALCKEYYRLVSENVSRYKPDIIGHFDLVTKYNSMGAVFDEESKKYKHIALEALDACCCADSIFEINCGAIRRGLRTLPYPSPFLLKRLLERSGKVLLGADCHHKDGLCFGFSDALTVLREIGFRSVFVFENGKFMENGI